MFDLFAAAEEAGTYEAPAREAYRVPSMEEVRAIPWNGLTAVSSFSGCGGSSMGFRMGGWRVAAAIEFIPEAAATYRANSTAHVYEADIRTLTGAEILDRIGLKVGELDCFEGSPPCSSWSTAGNGQTTRERPCDTCGGTGRTDEQTDGTGGHPCPLCAGTGRLAGIAKKYSDSAQRTDDLFEQYVRLIDEMRPRSFVAENVPGMLRGEDARAYIQAVTAGMGELGYRVDAQVLNSAKFGVPQERERLIFIGYRNDLGIFPSFPGPTVTEPYTVQDALEWTVEDRPEDVADSSMVGKAVGRTWKHITEARAAGLPDPDFTRLPCERCGGELNAHLEIERTSTGAVTKAKCLDGEKAVIAKAYFMLTVPRLDKPSPTVTATGAQTGAASVCHPTSCRKFTPAELRALCSFPQDFVLTGSREQRAERMGRAVPPLLYAAVSAHVAKTLKGIS